MLAKRAQVAFQIIRERFFTGTVTRHRWGTAEAAVMTTEATAHSAAEAAAMMAAEATAHSATRPARRRAVRSLLPEETA